MTLFIPEGIDGADERKLGSIMGIDVTMTKLGWLNPITQLAIGIIFAIVTETGDGLGGQLVAGVIFGVLAALASAVHSLGHIISSMIVGAPVSSLIVSMAVTILHYDDKSPTPPKVDLWRSLGGPVASLLVGIIFILLAGSLENNIYLMFFGGFNVLFGVLTILPLPSLDGIVIWRAWREMSK